ncbi:hypothetical protein [Maribellus sp. YY47]|uniref:hypothetical protein n=1 Tax=Maribellus sp. YY47 TaxID=2929486 RepID=UPI00200159D7|nr:hypothetical protein [Maribellus sp. YY47]MCK3683990.1 hypothetical protein [Maribellus sp. YY47]
MAKLTDFQFLENVLIYSSRIAVYTEKLDEGNFLNDRKTVDAVLYCVLQFGKNVSSISDGFKKNHTEIMGMDWAMLAILYSDDHFDEEELWDIVYGDDVGILKFYPVIESMYLRERQKLGNSEIARIPARAFKTEDTLPLRKGKVQSFKFDASIDKKRGFNPMNHITSHSSIWTVKKR